jgi:hypothetical protein
MISPSASSLWSTTSSNSAFSSSNSPTKTAAGSSLQTSVIQTAGKIQQHNGGLISQDTMEHHRSSSNSHEEKVNEEEKRESESPKMSEQQQQQQLGMAPTGHQSDNAAEDSTSTHRSNILSVVMTSVTGGDNSAGAGGVVVEGSDQEGPGGHQHGGLVQHESPATPVSYDGGHDHSQRMHNHQDIRHNQQHSPLRYMANYPTQEMANSTPATPTLNSTSQNSRRGRGRTVSGESISSSLIGPGLRQK